MNLEALVTDVPAELVAVKTFVAGIEKLVTDAKAAGFTTIVIADIEALAPDAEGVVADTDKVITDL